MTNSPAKFPIGSRVVILAFPHTSKLGTVVGLSVWTNNDHDMGDRIIAVDGVEEHYSYEGYMLASIEPPLSLVYRVVLAATLMIGDLLTTRDVRAAQITHVHILPFGELSITLAGRVIPIILTEGDAIIRGRREMVIGRTEPVTEPMPRVLAL